VYHPLSQKVDPLRERVVPRDYTVLQLKLKLAEDFKGVLGEWRQTADLSKNTGDAVGPATIQLDALEDIDIAKGSTFGPALTAETAKNVKWNQPAPEGDASISSSPMSLRDGRCARSLEVPMIEPHTRYISRF